MFCKASKWLGCEKSYSAPIVIKNFNAKNIETAVIDICGLGYYELFLNGNRVGDEYFKPAVSDYSERDFSTWAYPLPDKTSHTIYYNSYDVTKYLKDGNNTLAVMLGNGFYRQTRRTCEGNTKFGDELLLRYDLRLKENGTVSRIYSDGSEWVVESFIKENNLFYGETHDYSAFDFSLLHGNVNADVERVHILPAPKAKLLKQRCKNDVVCKTIFPTVVKKTDESVIYDVGENISGFVCFKAKTDCVTIRHAEEMKDGALDFASTGGNWQVSANTYLNAQGKTVHPWFSWSGFRYFEIFGEADEIQAWFIHSDVKATAEFTCGNENINWLFDAYLRTQLGNMHGGVPSDCPHRERLGYTGDGQLTAENTMLLTNSRTFYEKWIQDIADCQDVESGHVQHTAPLFGGGGGPGGWGCAIVIVPYTYYKIYGDLHILKKYYKNMLEYLRCMKGFSENGLIVKEREKGWCLGDWGTPESVLLPPPFVNTFYYIRSMEIVEKISKLIGKPVHFRQEIEHSKAAIQENYFQTETGNYCGGVQGANAFALTLGLGDRRTKENLLKQYRTEKVLDTGIFGTDILMEYLTQNGEIQLLYELLCAEKYPSFGYMKAKGATTLWEAWCGDHSHNHPMYCGCIKQLFYGLLGIQADVAFRNVTLTPKYIDGIGFIHAKLKLPSGTLRIQYQYRDGHVYPTVKATGKMTVTVRMENTSL